MRSVTVADEPPDTEAADATPSVPAPTGYAAVVMPARPLPLVSVEPDDVMPAEEMVELLAANPELDIRSYVIFATWGVTWISLPARP